MDKSEQFADMIAKACQMVIERKVAPLVSRLDDIAKALEGFMLKGDAAKFVTADGFRVEIEAIRQDVKTMRADVDSKPTVDALRAEQASIAKSAAADMFSALPIPKDGAPGKAAEVDYTKVYSAISDLLDQKMAELPIPKNGADGKDGQPGTDGKDGRDGVDGKDGAVGPQGKDGKDGIDGKNGADGLQGKDGSNGLDGKDGSAGAVGKDGANGIDGKDGSDGLNGKDGRDGVDGRSVDPEEVRAIVGEFVTRAVEEIPKAIDGKDGTPGKDGEHGRDGRDGQPGSPGAMGEKGLDGRNGIDGRDGIDGLGLDDMSLELKEDGRTHVYRMSGGGREKTFELVAPWQIYRGVHIKGRRYQKGDSVTFAGSQFTAKVDTDKPPETDDWVCNVKRGRDGQDSGGGK